MFIRGLFAIIAGLAVICESGEAFQQLIRVASAQIPSNLGTPRALVPKSGRLAQVQAQGELEVCTVHDLPSIA